MQKMNDFQDAILKAWARPDMDARHSDPPALLDPFGTESQTNNNTELRAIGGPKNHEISSLFW